MEDRERDGIRYQMVKKGSANKVTCKQRLQVDISCTFGFSYQGGDRVNMSHLNVPREVATYLHSFISEYLRHFIMLDSVEGTKMNNNELS